MKRFYKKIDFNIDKPFAREVDDNYDYRYFNIENCTVEDSDGGYFEIDENEAGALEVHQNFKGITWDVIDEKLIIIKDIDE